jgi:hypothetical protein
MIDIYNENELLKNMSNINQENNAEEKIRALLKGKLD